MSPKRSSGAPPQQSAPTLVVLLDEAREEIVAQIGKGRELRARSITNPDQFAEVKAAEERWSDYNRTLLLQFFSNDVLATEYNFTYVGRVALQTTYARPSLVD